MNLTDESTYYLYDGLSLILKYYPQAKVRMGYDRGEIHKDYKEIMTLDELVEEYTYTYMVRGR